MNFRRTVPCVASAAAWLLLSGAAWADGAGLEGYALSGTADTRGKTLAPGLGAEPPEALAGTAVRWHQIGHLQRNKVRRTLPYATLLHSADSVRLLNEVNRVSGETNRTMPVLLEVNISGDEAKHGFVPEQMRGVLTEVSSLAHVQVRGLMAMAGLEGDLEAAREDFSRLRRLRDELRHELDDTAPVTYPTGSNIFKKRYSPPSSMPGKGSPKFPEVTVRVFPLTMARATSSYWVMPSNLMGCTTSTWASSGNDS